MIKNGKNLDDLQDLNRAFIIRYLAMHEGCSRTDVARAAGLRQASITKIMHALMEGGVAVETGFTEGLKGRRSIGLALNYSRNLVLGLKISWERLVVGVFDLKGRVHGEAFSSPIDGRLRYASADAAVDTIIRVVADLRRRHPGIIAMGAAVPGPFHRAGGSVYLPAPGAENNHRYYPFLEKLREAIDLPIVMDHDANAGGLAYWWFRGNCDTRMALLYLLASEGVGGGVVAKGQIFTGQRGHSAEIGHIIIDAGGRDCVCGGRGCLDAYASSLAVERRALDLLPSYPHSSLADRERIGIDAVFAAMRQGDELAVRLVRDAGNSMGHGLASLIPVFDPDLVVVGDLMAGGGDLLLEGINESVDRLLSPFYRKPRIVLTDPEDDLVLLGSATIAIDHVFNNPTKLLMAEDGIAAGRENEKP